MKTKKGLMISTIIVLIVSIAIASSGVDASMKAQLQNAVGKDGEPCEGVCVFYCGGPEDECHHCTKSTYDCQSEGDVLADDAYDQCFGTSATKYCRFNHTVNCGYRFYCESSGVGNNQRCVNGTCESHPFYNNCRQCERGDPVPGGGIIENDELCQ